MSILPKKTILKLNGYKPNFGKSNLRKVIHLSANENPLGCSNKISNSLNKNNFNRYPPQLSEELVLEIAKKHNLDKNKIILGNGSDELISIIRSTWGQRSDRYSELRSQNTDLDQLNNPTLILMNFCKLLYL